MIFVYFLLSLLAIILIFLLSLLLLPANYSFRLLYYETLYGFITINTGILKLTFNSNPSLLQIKIFGVKIYSGIPQNKPSKTKAPNKQTNSQFNIRLFLRKNVLKSSLTLIMDLFNLIKPSKAKISGRIGLPEPHETALLLAVASSIQPLIHFVEITLEPLWNEEHIEFDIQIIGKITPAILILKIIIFLLRKEIRSVWIKLIKNRKYNPKVQPSANLTGIY